MTCLMSTHTQPALDETTTARVLKTLRQFWGYTELRHLQAEAIACALAGRDSLTVLPTGGGKSLCYQIPPILDDSLDVVVSPLIALMKDQVDGLREAGYPAAALYSGMTVAEKRDIHHDLHAGKIRLLFVSPERLVMDDFLITLKRLGVRRFTIDEAHCISQWGHDFRPEYRQMAILREAFPDASIHAYTATATPRVRDDIVQQLHLKDPIVLVGCFDRPNLIYRILPKTDVNQQAIEAIARHPKEAIIIYCLSRKDTESLASWLISKKIKAAHYHAGMTSKERHRTQEAFADESLDVVVATVAFGMGIDRSNVRCVIHTTLPKSIESYQQETGRAGRDGLEAECVLFYSAGDVMRWKSLMDHRSTSDEDGHSISAADLAVARKVEDELLRGMQRLCTSARCRHRALSEYFGQDYERPNCAACDVCMEEVEEIANGTVLAQKILSCVARAEQRFGIGHIVDVLLGSDTDGIRRVGHNSLSTYGIVKDLSRPALMSAVYQLVDHGLLLRTDGDRPILKLTESSRAVLKGEQNVRLLKPREKLRKRTVKGEQSMKGVDNGLFEALRQWRQNEAKRRHVPAYVIFHDATLTELARHQPRNIEGLATIPGMGEKKLTQWGTTVCDIINSHLSTSTTPD